MLLYGASWLRRRRLAHLRVCWQYISLTEDCTKCGVFFRLRWCPLFLLQLVAIGLALAVESLEHISAALALMFPLLIIMLVPVRAFLLPRLFSRDELEALDPGSEELNALLAPSGQSAQSAPAPSAAAMQYGSFSTQG